MMSDEQVLLKLEAEKWQAQIAALTDENAVLKDKLGLLLAAIGPYSTTDIALKAIERDRAERNYWRSIVQEIHDRSVILHHDDIAQFCREAFDRKGSP